MNSPKLEAPDNDVLGARMMDSRTKDGKENKTALATHPFAFHPEKSLWIITNSFHLIARRAFRVINDSKMCKVRKCRSVPYLAVAADRQLARSIVCRDP